MGVASGRYCCVVLEELGMGLDMFRLLLRRWWFSLKLHDSTKSQKRQYKGSVDAASA